MGRNRSSVAKDTVRDEMENALTHEETEEDGDDEFLHPGGGKTDTFEFCKYHQGNMRSGNRNERGRSCQEEEGLQYC